MLRAMESMNELMEMPTTMRTLRRKSRKRSWSQNCLDHPEAQPEETGRREREPEVQKEEDKAVQE